MTSPHLTAGYALTNLEHPNLTDPGTFAAVLTQHGVPVLRVRDDGGGVVYLPMTPEVGTGQAAPPFLSVVAVFETFARRWAGQRWAPTVAEADTLVAHLLATARSRG